MVSGPHVLPTRQLGPGDHEKGGATLQTQCGESFRGWLPNTLPLPASLKEHSEEERGGKRTKYCFAVKHDGMLTVNNVGVGWELHTCVILVVRNPPPTPHFFPLFVCVPHECVCFRDRSSQTVW